MNDFQIEFDADNLPKRNPVYCVAVGGVLDLDEDDLGHADVPDLWERLRRDKRPMPERGLYCPTCIKERPREPEWMYVYERADGLKIAAHYNPDHKPHPHESDVHVAYKERIARAAEQGGFRAELEARTVNGKARSDVRVIGDGGKEFGFEPQLQDPGAAAIRRRDRARREVGILPVWHVTDPYHDLIDNAAWARTDKDLPAHYIRDSQRLEVRGGIYELIMEKCDRFSSSICPVQRTGRCGQYHPTWKIAARQLDDLVREIAAGESVSVVQKFARFTRWFWTSAADRQRYVDNGGEFLEPEKEIRARIPRQREYQAVDHRDVECTRDRVDSFVPGEKRPPRDSGESFRAAITISSTRATGRPAERAADLAGDERQALAKELGCSTTEIGPCALCDAPIVRYGDKARGTLCSSCKTPTS